MQGRTIHCDTLLLAGQRKATSGNAGFCTPLWLSIRPVPAPEDENPSFLFRRGLCDGVELIVAVVARLRKKLVRNQLEVEEADTDHVTL
jgi:hypothetical protein